MKNVCILHGTENNHTGNWFPWLADELKRRGYRVFSPDLPKAERPNIERYNKYIFDHWTFDSDSIIVGHSSGAVAILGLLQELPDDVVIDTAILVAGFIDDLGDEDSELFLKPFDYEIIKTKAKRFIVFQSDNDRYVEVRHGEALRDLLKAEYVFLPNQGHFNLEEGQKYKQFPEVLQKIIES